MLRATKSTTVLAYQSPHFSELIRFAIHEVRREYQAAGGVNPERLTLISALEAVHTTLDRIQHTEAKSKPTEDELTATALGMWIACKECIVSQYTLLNPEGSRLNKGSELYKILYRHLGMSENNDLSMIEMLKYMEKSYNFIFNNLGLIHKFPDSRFDLAFLQKGINPETIRLHMIDAMTWVFKSKPINPFTANLLRALTTEASLDRCMMHLDANYQVKKGNATPNPKRLFQARVAVALVNLMPTKPDLKDKFDAFMSDSEKIKRGWLIYIMLSIEQEYLARSPKNAVLYTYCCEYLNVDDLANIDDKTKVTCLAELHSYISDHKNKKELERVLNDRALFSNKAKTEICTEMLEVPDQIKGMIHHIKNKPFLPISKTTITAAAMGAILMSFPGYGVGSAVGYAVSLTDSAVIPKRMLTGAAGFVMNIVLGDSGDYLKYYASDLVIDAASERICAKLFEAIAALIGAVTGGAISIGLTEITPQAFKELCGLFTHIYSNVSPTVAKAVDPDFIQCLLNLPEEVFPLIHKDKLRHVTNFGFFPPAQDERREVVHSDQPEVGYVPQ